MNSNRREFKRAEMKLKLSQIRERSKQLLKRHNWKKYFDEYELNTLNSSSGCSSMAKTSNNNINNTNSKDSAVDALFGKECLIKNQYNKIISAIEIDLSTNDDEYDYYDEDDEEDEEATTESVVLRAPSNISKIVFDASTILSRKEDKKMFQTPVRTQYNNNKPKNLCSTLFSLKKKIYFNEQDDSVLDKEVSYYFNQQAKPVEKKIKLDESFTFIADLASTSTPTRVSHAPITSTPKQLTHNPFKYHPTQTIRNKLVKKKNPTRKQQVKKSTNDCSNCRVCLQLNNNKKRTATKKTKNTTVLSDSQVSCETCHFKQKVKLNKFTNVTKRTRAVQQPVNKLKFKSISNNNIEISLADLLYTPSKLRDLVNKSTSKSIKTSVAVKSAPVISSATVAALAKVYYL